MSDDKQHYEGAPGARVMTKAEQGKENWKWFETEMNGRAVEIANLLPRHVTREKFIAVAIAAVKQNPSLLEADRRSLFGAVTKAAQDGLLPDGREGTIQTYNTNVAKRGEKERWVKMAQWMPMTYGIRKRARELDDIIIDTQVVYANDLFKQMQGDEPSIIHEPVDLGKPRGAIVGAYAIFKKGGQILHREVMDTSAIEATREQSKAKNSLMWTTFQTEGYRKSVLRRGAKSVPVSESLDQIIRRDDDMFDFAQDRPPAKITAPAAPSADDETTPQTTPPALTPPSPPSEEDEEYPEELAETTMLADWDVYFEKMLGELKDAKDAAATQAVHDTVADSIAGDRDRGEFSEAVADQLRARWEVLSSG